MRSIQRNFDCKRHKNLRFLVYTLYLDCDRMENNSSLLCFLAGERIERIMDNKAKMKELPISEKPYEKCLRFGAGCLSDAELLAAILRTGAQGITALELSREVLRLSCIEKSLLGLHHVSIEDLMKIRGVGKVKAVQLKCIVELSRRMSKAAAEETLCFTDPQTVAQYYMEDFRHSLQEQMAVMMLNTKGRLLGEQLISKGTVNASLITPREIFIEALHHHAVGILLVHNHPSGDPTPSREDIQITERIQQAGTLIGIEVLDHVIIGDKKYISFRERKLL